MKLIIGLTAGEDVEIGSISDEDAASLVEEFQSGSQSVLTFSLEPHGGIHLARQHIVSVYLEPESTWP